MPNDESQPEDTYPNAGRDSGYVAPVGENLVNVLTEHITRLETKIMQRADEARAESTKLSQQIAPIARHQVDLGTKLHELKHDNRTRFDALADAQERTHLAVEGVRSDVGKLSNELAGAVERIGTLEERADQSEAHNRARDERVTALEQRVDADSKAIRAVETEQAALKARQTTLEMLHNRLVSHLSQDKALLVQLNKESGGVE